MSFKSKHSIEQMREALNTDVQLQLIVDNYLAGDTITLTLDTPLEETAAFVKYKNELLYGGDGPHGVPLSADVPVSNKWPENPKLDPATKSIFMGIDWGMGADKAVLVEDGAHAALDIETQERHKKALRAPMFEPRIQCTASDALKLLAGDLGVPEGVLKPSDMELEIFDLSRRLLEKIEDLKVLLAEADQQAKDALAHASAGYEGKINKAVDLGVKYGGYDGSHHKTWVIDQMIRALTGCPMIKKSARDLKGVEVYEYEVQGESEEYVKLVKESCDGADGPDTYTWDVGIPP